tara:strand:- start:98 stop:589 length:492 start_codon:yes stop_codon:yes gene_type:complete
MDFATKLKFNMKKILIILFIPIIFTCSDDSEDQNNNQTSELTGTYSFINGYEGPSDNGQDGWYDCPSDYFEFTDSLFLIGFTDSDNCSDTSYLETYSAPYEVLSNTSQQIEGIINFVEIYGTEVGNDYFVFNKSSQILNRYFTLDGTDPSASNWDILEVWQKN